VSEQVKTERNVEASVLPETQTGPAGVFKNAGGGFMRLQSDERLVALTRRGNEGAFETLVTRYRTRLQAFIRHMVGSTEDAEDILQEVFVAAHKAMLADDRDINVRPWLYRIARNRSLNHLRRPKATGVDSMDIYEGGAAVATADRVHDKLELEELIGDVKSLPETQRTALLLREMGQLSYDQIAVAMDTSVPSVKSLLVRARVSLAEASEARKMTCDEVRIELAAEAEGIQKVSAPAKRHVQGCERCRSFKRELAVNNRKLALIAPIGLLAMAKHAVALKLLGVSGAFSAIGIGGGSSGASAGAGAGAAGAGAAGAAVAGAGATTVGAGAGAGLGMGAIAGSAAAGLATVAIAVGGVAQVANESTTSSAGDAVRPVTSAIVPLVEEESPRRAATASRRAARPAAAKRRKTELADTRPTTPVAATPTPVDVTTPVAAPDPPKPATPVIDEETSAVVLDPVEQQPPPPDPTAPSGPTGGTSSGDGASEGASGEIGDVVVELAP
jgi:RNA polymerase sigma factor (sigma-70 family)